MNGGARQPQANSYYFFTKRICQKKRSTSFQAQDGETNRAVCCSTVPETFPLILSQGANTILLYFSSTNTFWNKALQRYRGELEEEEIDEYQTILEAGTLENLVEQIRTLEPPNAREKAVINRLDSVLKFVNDFSAVVAVCFGADAKLAALVWGSIRMILTLASSAGDTFRDVVDMLEELSLTLPRFRYYEKSLPMDDAFETALVDVYTEVICFYARAIHFFRTNPHGLLRRNAWAEFHGDFSKTIQRIRRLSSAVEGEAEAARMRLDRSGYAEVLDLMKSLKKSRLSDSVKGCYSVPYTANPRFWGREEVFERIRQGLDQAGGQQGLRTYALWGMGGVGKTQIAVHYATRSRERYDTTLWISADNTVQASQSFRDIAVRLGLVESERENEDAISAMMKVKQWLTETSKLPRSDTRASLNNQRSSMATHI